MKFTTAWAKTAAQNVTLKVATVTLSIVALMQLYVIVDLNSRDLKIIERACYSKVFQAKSLDPSNNEKEAFLVEALSMRFDTQAYIKEGFLSLEENLSREKEQSSLKQKQIFQKIIVDKILASDKELIVNADRLLTVGKIKTVLPLEMKVKIQRTNRTESNPYGLILSSLSPIEAKEEK